jgi:hypothetical protein
MLLLQGQVTEVPAASVRLEPDSLSAKFLEGTCRREFETINSRNVKLIAVEVSLNIIELQKKI